MIILHHLNQSRSIRVLRLLEEIGVPYQIKKYQRRSDNFLAPDDLKKIHTLGKSPVLEIDEMKITESGAIVEFLISRYAPNLAPSQDSLQYGEYLQWMYFAESSLMLPLLLNLFASKETEPLEFLPQYATSEMQNVLNYLNQHLEGKKYILGDNISGADFMLSSTIDVLKERDMLDAFPNIKFYGETLSCLSSWQRAAQIEKTE